MRARLLICLVALLACVKRITPDPGGARTTYSGVTLRFGEQQAASVVHAFPRSGVYTVVETIRDKDGQTRSARTHVTALRETVQMAVPADARAALMVPA